MKSCLRVSSTIEKKKVCVECLCQSEIKKPKWNLCLYIQVKKAIQVKESQKKVLTWLDQTEMSLKIEDVLDNVLVLKLE